MPTKKSAVPPKIYQLKVTLLGTSPPIWRRLLVVEALNDPNHERREEILDWIGDDFDPQAFSVDKVNRMLPPLRRHRHKTSRLQP